MLTRHLYLKSDTNFICFVPFCRTAFYLPPSKSAKTAKTFFASATYQFWSITNAITKHIFKQHGNIKLICLNVSPWWKCFLRCLKWKMCWIISTTGLCKLFRERNGAPASGGKSAWTLWYPHAIYRHRAKQAAIRFSNYLNFPFYTNMWLFLFWSSDPKQG